MPRRYDSELLSDILEAIKRIEKYTKRLSYQKFMKDEKTQDAIIRNLEIIGEATKYLSSEFKSKHRGVEWRKISDMRNILIHFYFGVSLDIVWQTAKDRLPEIKPKLESALKEMKKK